MEKNKIRISNGWSLSNGKLTILVPAQTTAELNMLTEDIFKRIQAGEVQSKLTENELSAEVWRLAKLMDKIVDDFPDSLDIFEYLPLTKSGSFPGNKNILIADSKCSTAALYDSGCDTYPEKRTIQLRLVPYYASEDDFIHDRKAKDARTLEINWFDSLRKTTPVFDEADNPSKPEATTKATYLKDDKSLPGHVYEEKSGSRYLVLNTIRFKTEPDYHGGNDPDLRPDQVNGYACCAYLRWTKKLETAMAGADDFNTLMHVLADSNKSEPWSAYEKLSLRQNPRKFVKHVGQVIDLSKTKSEKFKKIGKNGIILKYYVEPGCDGHET